MLFLDDHPTTGGAWSSVSCTKPHSRARHRRCRETRVRFVRAGRGAARTPPSYAAALNPRSRSELPTTKTDENAIAAPAIIGLSSPAAASGRAATL